MTYNHVAALRDKADDGLLILLCCLCAEFAKGMRGKGERMPAIKSIYFRGQNLPKPYAPIFIKKSPKFA